MATPTWFITGSSNGFGLLLTLRVLAAGHKVIATVRDFERSAAAVKSIEQAGGNVIKLDTSESRDSIIQKIQDAEKKFGTIDYLVNNAGYSTLGPVESFTESQVEQQIRTNVFGPLYAMQAVLPSMRQRRSGTIINISSVAGQDAQPSCGLYSASKFGLEGLSESLSKEMKEFGVNVLIVEPGAFRTNFLTAKVVSDTIQKEYQGTTVEEVLNRFDEYNGKQPGDPQKGVDIIFEVATGQGAAGHLKGKILRLPLGQDCFNRIQNKVNLLQKDLDTTREIGIKTNFDA